MGRAKKMPKEKRLERTAKRAARRQLISAKRHARRTAKKVSRDARHPEVEVVAEGPVADVPEPAADEATTAEDAADEEPVDDSDGEE